MQDLYEESIRQVNEAKDKIKNGDNSLASILLRNASKNLDSAIINAISNSKTNFIEDYKRLKDEIKLLLRETIRNSVIKNNPKTVHIPGIGVIDTKIRDKTKERINNNTKESDTGEINQKESDKEKNNQDEIINNRYQINNEEPINQEKEINQEEPINNRYQINNEEPINEEERIIPKPIIPKPITSIIKPSLIIENKKIDFSLIGDIIVKLGKDEEDNVIYWEPMKQANQHLVAVGMSGTGKTTAVRTILYQLEKQNVPLIIFDLHDDFDADKKINFNNITINPLELDGLTPKEKAIEFAYICKRIFKLGDQQENKLREAIVYCYEEKGIDTLDKSTYHYPPPTLKDVNDFLEANRDGKTIDTLLGRVKFFHRVELFMSETRCPFNDMFHGSTVIKLIEFSDNPELQTALCEIFLNKLLFTVKKAGQSKLRAYCVIDEAHILDDGKDSYRSPLVKIAREARKYGLGLILASQMPKDFSKSVLHNTATIMTLKFNAKEEARAISEHMFGISDEDVLNLDEVGNGFIKLSSDVKKLKFFQKSELD